MGHEEIKIPPQNLEAERSVLGSMMIDEEAIGQAIEILDEEWFYENAHRSIYRAITDLYNARRKVDLITISEKLKNDGQLETVGGVTYLSTIINFVPTSAHIEHYANIVKEKGVLRKLIKSATQIITESYEPKTDVDDVVDNAERLIFEVADLKQKQRASHIKDIVKENMNKLDMLYQRKQHITGLATGFTKITI